MPDFNQWFIRNSQNNNPVFEHLKFLNTANLFRVKHEADALINKAVNNYRGPGWLWNPKCMSTTTQGRRQLYFIVLIVIVLMTLQPGFSLEENKFYEVQTIYVFC